MDKLEENIKMDYIVVFWKLVSVTFLFFRSSSLVVVTFDMMLRRRISLTKSYVLPFTSNFWLGRILTENSKRSEGGRRVITFWWEYNPLPCLSPQRHPKENSRSRRYCLEYFGSVCEQQFRLKTRSARQSERTCNVPLLQTKRTRQPWHSPFNFAAERSPQQNRTLQCLRHEKKSFHELFYLFTFKSSQR